MIKERFEEVLSNQTDKGLKKYGKTLDDANLNVIDLVNHLEEELVDAFIYLQEIKKKVE